MMYNEPDKFSKMRQEHGAIGNDALQLQRHNEQLALARATREATLLGFKALMKYMDGKTTKTEVINQLKSISTPDIDKVVEAVSKLDSDVLSNKIDLKPLEKVMQGVQREVSLIPKSHPKEVEQREDVKVTNLSEIKLDNTDVVKAIKGLKLVAEAPIINEKEVDLKPLQNIMTDLLKAFNKQKPVVIPEFPTIPETDLTKVEKKLDESNKHLKVISEKKFGGGGGGGGGTSFQNSVGEMVRAELVGGAVPVTSNTYITIIREDAGDPQISYIGKAVPGTATSAAAWQIASLDENTNLDLLYADGGAFTQVYDNREGLTYA